MSITLDELAASRIANVVSLGQIETEYGGDAYGTDAEWAAAVPDLGENAVGTQEYEILPSRNPEKRS